jgi:galactokinase
LRDTGRGRTQAKWPFPAGQASDPTQKNMDKSRIAQAFQRLYQEPPHVIVRAPGRVNLIGEHTDYNDGFVLPMAIDRATWIALRPRADRQVHVTSLNLDDQGVFDLDNLLKGEKTWVEYVKGTAWALQEAGLPLQGWEGVLATDVPIGASLSSSAALEMSVARAFQATGGWEWNGKQVALLGQKAENEWLGAQTGVMDQLISALGQEGHALLIDCRSYEFEAVPLAAEMAVVILDTNIRRSLVTSAYNERRAQCEEAADYFMVRSLRDLSLTQFLEAEAHLPDLMQRRARHVITESLRTLNAAHAIKKGNWGLLGQLMKESHDSLRDDYEVSIPEMDKMVAIAQEQPGCIGARMTGGGFGGCAVAIVLESQADAFAHTVAALYEEATDQTPNVYISQAGAGASIAQP